METVYKIFDYDKELLLYINSKHTEWLDPIMLLLSSFTTWIIVCIAIMALMIYKGGRWRFYAPIGLLITIGANAAINNIIKNIVARPRPIHVEAYKGIIHSIETYERSYSFYSGHSSNSFAMILFAILYFRNKTFTCFSLLWAIAVAYSRMYLAKHYPIDVFTGIIVGSIVGIICYKLFESFQEKKLRPNTNN